MTISVDWAGAAATPYRIYVPKADMSLVQVGPPEIYELDIDAFRLTLRDLEDDEDGGRPWPQTHRHDTEATLSGTTYARRVTILAPYSVEFENGTYQVNCVGANHNLGDVKVVNSVSLLINNSAGLISTSEGYVGKAFFSYDPATDALTGLAWLERNGLVATDPTNLSLTLYDDGGVEVFTEADGGPDAQGIFKISKDAPGLVKDRGYYAILTITVGGSDVVFGKGAFTVGS